MQKVSFKVSINHDNMTVGDFLSKENHVSRRLITKLKQTDNGITKNGVHTKTIDRVSIGDIIEITLSDEKTLEQNPSLSVPIVYEDDELIVFDKPAFMPVHPSHGHINDTLGNFFSHHCQGLTCRTINRLDRDTSGLCMVAKNSYCAKLLQSSLKKTYYATVCGITPKFGTINAPIARQAQSIITRCVCESGQFAVTHYEKIFENQKYSLLKISLETGRTHQIRVHFSHIGYPLCGDDMYGGSMSDINRQALHCGELEFTHPISGKAIVLSSPLPQDIASLFK